MQRVELPDGGHATIRDKVNVNGRELVESVVAPAGRAIRRVKKLREDQDLPDDALADAEQPVEKVQYTEAEMVALQRFIRAGFVAWVKNWTIDEPLPTTIDEVGELDPDIYAPIAKVTGPLTIKALKRPDVSVDDAYKKEGGLLVPDLDSPTGPSTGTDADERASKSTTSENGTASSAAGPESSTSGVAIPA